MNSTKCRSLEGSRYGAVAPGLLLAFISGCHGLGARGGDTADAEPVAASSTVPGMVSGVEPDASSEVDPPAPVVAEDPNVPLNEAVVGAAPVAADYTADIAPPAPPVEDEPPQPEADDSWIPGYWWWSTPFHRYVWVSGAWRHPPPDQYWTAGSWGPYEGHYVWTPGYWGPRGYARDMIGAPPPPLRVESYGAPPGEGFSWEPGYYAWRGGVYDWVGGSWARPPQPGMGWIEPRYVGVGGRYYLQPGRWDFAPARRGTVYAPDVNARAGVRFSPRAVPQGVVNAHANFVTASAHAIAQGATRTPSGGFLVRGGSTPPHFGGGGANNNEPRQGGNPAAANEPRPGSPPTGNEPRQGGNPPGNERRPGGNAPPGNEPRPGNPPEANRPPPGNPPREENEVRRPPAEAPRPAVAARPVEARPETHVELHGASPPPEHAAPPPAQHSAPPPRARTPEKKP